MKEKNKKIILLITICTLTIVVLIFALKLNEKRLDELSKNSVIHEYLNEIKYEELSTYIIEEPNSIVYVSNSSDEKSKLFEKNFKEVIKKYNLENKIIYININGINTLDPFYQNAPQMIFYKSGAVSDIVDCTTLTTNKKIIKMLDERSVIND